MKNRADKIFIIILAMAAVLVLVRCPFSFQQSDEGFYISTVHRLFQGDKLVTDEWHPTQFYSPILLPFYALYRLFVPTGAGVILYFRILMAALSVFMGFFSYRCIKLICISDNGGTAGVADAPGFGASFFAFAAALILMLYSKSNILGPSYNNLCVHFTVLSVLVDRVGDEKSRGKRAALSGFFIALAVLCMPYMAAGIIVYCAVRLTGLVSGRNGDRSILYYISAIALTAVMYLVSFFRLTHIGEIVTNFEYIFKDPEHRNGFFKCFKKTVQSFVSFNSIYVLVFIAAVTVLLLVMSMRREAFRERLFGSGSWALLFIPALCHTLYKGMRRPGYPAIALMVWALPLIAVFFCRGSGGRKRPEKPAGIPQDGEDLPQGPADCRNGDMDRRVAGSCLLFGLFVALSYAGGSDTRLAGTTSGFTLMAFALFICLAQLLNRRERMKAGKTTAVLMYAAVSMILAVMLFQRMMIVVRDADLWKLTSRIDSGVAKGLFTTPEHREQYDRVLALIDELNEKKKDGMIFFTKVLPWAYVCSDLRCGAPTTWRMKLSEGLLESYYKLHPDRIPDVVVILEDDIAAYDTCIFSNKKGEKTPNSNSEKGVLWEYINSEDYEILERDVAKVYMR